jgi:zinc protease
MTRRRVLAVGATAAFLLCLRLPIVIAQQTATDVSASQPDISELNVNGLKVLVKRRAGSQTVAAGLFIRGGARNVTAKDAGVEALMLDAATQASEHFPREQFRREVARTGTEISWGINDDYSAFTLGCTRAQFERGWALFTDAALHPSFAEDDFARVKSRDLVALADTDSSPDESLQRLEAKVIYAGHPYANDPDGNVESVGSLTVGDAKRFHEGMMQTSRLLLVIVGDLDLREITDKVQASFGKLPRGKYVPTAAPTLSFSAPTFHVTEKALPTNYVQGVYAAPSPASPDIYAMRVATSILHERIFEEVRLKRALSYAPSASLGSQEANLGTVYVTATDANQAVQLMQNEIRRLRATDASQDELKSAAQQFLLMYYLGQETNAAQAGALAQAEIVGNGWRTSAEFLDRIRAVTAADVRRVANTYMRNLQFVAIGNPQSLNSAIFLE